MEFEQTGLKDSTLLRQAHDLAYAQFRGSADESQGDVPDDFIDGIYLASAIAAAKLLQDTDVSEPVIAAAIAFGAVHESSAIMDKLDKTVVPVVQELLRDEEQLTIRMMMNGETEKSLTEIYTEALAANMERSEEQITALKAKAIVSMEYAQIYNDPGDLHIVVDYARAVRNLYPDQGDEKLGQRLQDTLGYVGNMVSSTAPPRIQ
ncbi:MAG: hypothetical protein H6867_10915 [Rhodospirillales bacterium]|nr:hypothetical protein [Rhodospirillales bacterium]MCB9996639.1 hypothetical protein [Rhodospirillales bacterium]